VAKNRDIAPKGPSVIQLSRDGAIRTSREIKLMRG
jgi:hypothetical protein